MIEPVWRTRRSQVGEERPRALQAWESMTLRGCAELPKADEDGRTVRSRQSDLV